MLNKNLRGLPDGSITPSVKLSHRDGVKHHGGKVRVYWPFVVFQIEGPRGYNITHAPSGCLVYYARTIREAETFAHTVRHLADWDFTSLAGKKAADVRRKCGHLIPRLQRITA